MTCREFADFITAYLSGELPPATRTQFEQHLAVCPNCVAYLRSFEETIALGRRAFDDDEGAVPDAVPDDLVQIVLALRRSG